MEHDIAAIREALGGCLALHGFREDCPACVQWGEAEAALDRVAARVERLAEALREIAEYPKDNDLLERAGGMRRIARAALAALKT